MKKVRVEEAVGMELCHDITAMRDGFKGAAFKRGHIIQETDIEKLLNTLFRDSCSAKLGVLAFAKNRNLKDTTFLAISDNDAANFL